MRRFTTASLALTLAATGAFAGAAAVMAQDGTDLKIGVVPVVNENDAVANEELRFGDNDSLAALVANLIEADVPGAVAMVTIGCM